MELPSGSQDAPPAVPATISRPVSWWPSGLRRDLVIGTVDAVAFSVMVGAGEMYLAAFVLALGLGPLVAGLVASVPLLIGAVVQLAAPLAVARCGGRRRWVVLCAVVQAASLLPLSWWALRGEARAWELLAAASVYWSAGMAAAPAWTAWTATLVPARVRTAYFAQRNRLAQAAVLAAFVAGGLLLRTEETNDAALAGFAILFAAAAAARLASAVCLWACREPRRQWRDRGGVAERSIRERVAAGLYDLRGGQAGRLVAFLCCFMFGAHFAGPYFTPYMLEALGFDYGEYLLVFGAGVLVKAVFLPAIGRLGSRVGSRRLLGSACLAIVPLALLWLPSGDVRWLVLVQFVAGTCWAAYELAVALLLFDLTGDGDRSGVVSVYNVGLALATVGGAACGGALLKALGETPTAYAAVFTVSCLLRGLAMPLLPRRRSAA
ncbi:MAG: MFS transporter [Planctomycetes bacterium]|nr:MFS transporter [Planctomycetota bacterium]